MKNGLTKLFREFFDSERTGGYLLIICTAVSLTIANSPLSGAYTSLFKSKIGFDIGAFSMNYPVYHWINDLLMAIFFLLVGLEIERELYIGELSDIRKAMLPIFAAVGGMLVPALIHFSLNAGTETQSGFGIPMATDIAFAIGMLSLLGKRVPVSIKVFLTALAIIDDLGAIIMIAAFYSKGFSLLYFALAMGIFAMLLIFNRLKVNSMPLYLIPGLFMWFFMHESGVHATITGVLLAFAIPFRDGSEGSMSYKLQHFLHKPVALVIIPLFALANTGIPITKELIGGLLSSNPAGIILGLFLGKPLGIFLLSLIAVKTGISSLPPDVKWKHVLGAGMLAGIGFTMSIFISLLAFDNALIVDTSKVAILCASVLSCVTGIIMLSIAGRQYRYEQIEN
ncbi:MAG: Na+/H+ antiporter NhaA [Ignavibacteria bacterium]|nr:Na+/H+ antiporter NhaA [Ignavibacteria bacterium]